MIRYGAIAREMRTMADEDLFFLRLQMLVVMAKAYLKGYPLGESRKAAVRENARHIFYQSLHYANRSVSVPAGKGGRYDDQFIHLFCQQVQLLAVMATSFASEHPMGTYRRQALADNVNRISGYLTEQLDLSDVPFLKVA